MSEARLPRNQEPRGLKRVFLLATGCVSLALGVLGVILPLLPATPFVLLSAFCFAGAWPTMHRRLAGSHLFGPMLGADPNSRYLPRRTKVGAIGFTLVSIAATIIFVADATWVRIVLGTIAVGVSAFISWIPSKPR